MENPFNKETLGKVKEQNASEQKKIRQKLISMGFNILAIQDIVYKLSKEKHPMFVLSIKKAEDAKEEFKIITEYYPITPNGLTTDFGMNLNLYSFLSFFMNSFSFSVKEVDDDDPYGSLLKQVEKFKTKKFRGIVMHKIESGSKGSTFRKASIINKFCTKLEDTSINEETAKTLSLVKDSRKTNYTMTPTNDAPDISDEKVSDLPF